MLYRRDPDPKSIYHAKLTNIARRMLDDKCMFFLGAGASWSPPPALPTADDLSKEMADRCGLNWHKYIPLSTVAFYYESYFTRNDLNALLIERICLQGVDPSPTLQKLMEILEVLESRDQMTYTFTTNYDEQFESAYRNKFNRDPNVVIYKGAHDPLDKTAKLNCTPRGELPFRARNWRPDKKVKTVLYKIHGTISQPEKKGMVITEEDYINFLANSLGDRDDEKKLLTYLMGELGVRTVVFIGYSLSDWNFRAIFKATVEESSDKDSRSYAIQYTDPSVPPLPLDEVRSKSQELFWNDKAVDILNVDAAQFIDDLMEVLSTEEALLRKAKS
jgi:SIR2-like domain